MNNTGNLTMAKDEKDRHLKFNIAQTEHFKSKPPSCKSSWFTQTILSVTHVLRHKTHVQFESFVILSTTHQPVPSALYIYLEFTSPLMLPHCASDHLWHSNIHNCLWFLFSLHPFTPFSTCQPERSFKNFIMSHHCLV